MVSLQLLTNKQQSNIPNVNGPECESLGFNHDIDAYRQYAGSANIAGKRIISTECGANLGEAYQQTLPELMWDVKRSIAGSVNNFIFHGFPFSGNVRCLVFILLWELSLIREPVLQHDLANIHHIHVPILRDAWSTSAGVGFLFRRNGIYRPASVHFPGRRPEERLGFLSKVHSVSQRPKKLSADRPRTRG